MRAFSVIALCIASGCVVSEWAIPLVDHANAKVDPTRPNDRATIDIALRFLSMDYAWDATHHRTWLAPTDKTLAVALAPELVHVPRQGDHVDAALVNVYVTNGELAAYCGSTVPLGIQIDVVDEDYVMQLDRTQLAVFCEP
jgi:hypothetical protein